MLGQEFIFWNTDLLSNQSAIESEQNTFYSHF